MNITERLLAAKKNKWLSFSDLGKVMRSDEVWVAALFYRQASTSNEEAGKLVSKIGLGSEVAAALTECPMKGLGPVVPTDLLIYRLYEVMRVYGMSIKAFIHEKFGDGIMSAIGFTMCIKRKSIPRVIESS